jgi:Na+-driven multidrug efflux pump
MFGINQGVQPIIGYNYGARKYDRVKEALKLGIMAAVTIATVGFVATRLFPEQLVSIFNRSDAELIAIGKMQMKISLSMLPLIGFQVVGSNYFQAVGKPKHASFLSLSRQFFFLIPALLIIPRFFGLKGVYASMPLADLLASVVTAVFLIREIRHLDSSHARGLADKKKEKNEQINVDKNIIKDAV